MKNDFDLNDFYFDVDFKFNKMIDFDWIVTTHKNIRIWFDCGP